MEINRGLLLSGFAGQRPVVSVEFVVNHLVGESVVGRVEHSVLFLFFLSNDGDSHDDHGSKSLGHPFYI